MSAHCDAELFALLAGELGREETLAVVAHLRECGACTSELVSVAVAYGSLRAARRVEDYLDVRGDVAIAEAVPLVGRDQQPPLQFRTRHRQRVLSLVAAAVVVVAAATGVSLALSLSRHPSPPVSAVAALHHMDAPVAATGEATVRTVGLTRQMEVVTKGLPTAPVNHYYEVWLLQPTTNKMLPVGVLSPAGESTYALASSIMAQYSAVDISLQTNDGTTAHSLVSVLRGSVHTV